MIKIQLPIQIHYPIPNILIEYKVIVFCYLYNRISAMQRLKII